MMFTRLAMVARWKPPHLGHQRVLEGLLGHCDHLTVGIGSANRYNEDNPFSAAETEAMLRCFLPVTVPILQVDDLGDPPRWAAQLAGRLGPQDALVTANPRVREWLEPYYRILHPVCFVPAHLRIALEGKMIRGAWRRQEPWRHMVSTEIARHLEDNDLVKRFQRQFA